MMQVMVLVLFLLFFWTINSMYMKLLIVYGTTEGQTRKIAEYLKVEAEKQGAKVTLCDATSAVVDPEPYDAVMIGASLHAGRYQSSVAHYIKAHLDVLNNKPTAFLAVSLTAAGDDEESWQELKEITQSFLSETGWRPSDAEYVAGALRYAQYDFLKKYLMRMIAKKAGEKSTDQNDKEYTDWSKLNAFLLYFLNHARVTASKLSEEIL
jgi:menaquinone-dependent protoporphyrinogen oxidase